MDRKTFLKSLLALPLTPTLMSLQPLHTLSQSWPTTPKMPVLFLGHGSPMNAIEDNEFVAGFRNIARQIPQPRAILCVSAHWETRGTWVTAMQHPPTIHDFGGFPKALFEVQYPAPGSPELAHTTQALLTHTPVGLDTQWGLDHGAWSVIKHLYPKADVPVVQLSLDQTKPPQYHYELAQQLHTLRTKGVLIVGSGNMVHNLGQVAWNRLHDTYGYDWALEVQSQLSQWIRQHDHRALMQFGQYGRAFQLAIPTPEHYLPLLYTLALQDKTDHVQLFNDKPVAGSLTMTSVYLG